LLWLRPLFLDESATQTNTVKAIASQVHIARLVSHLSKLGREYKIKMLDEGWLQVLSHWAKSDNKQIRLATVNALHDLLLDDIIAMCIAEQYGVTLFVEIAEMVDIDVYHATEKVINYLKSQGHSGLTASTSTDDWKLDDNFDGKYLNN